ncbi:MAG: CRTAC1 family protein [Planctomycetaceae bacterium]|jgi:enediyne biosynthesis protein E4|nr:CRTAC1 family protein [Planctomycetaceae bacterium]MBT6487806.1 CRTAC1 family protein [Planctomycetaceae bacterium]MBT6497292.1 CRTAC1 family protein [Planctomycetaceae bacterium]
MSCNQGSSPEVPKRTRKNEATPKVGTGLSTMTRSDAFVAPKITPKFTDVAELCGVAFERFSDIVPGRFFLPEIMGGGAAWFDYDGDGWLDLYVVNGCQLDDPDLSQTNYVNRLFRNEGNGSFSDVTFSSGALENGYGQGCAVGDFNADGFPDLYVTNFGKNSLLENNGDGTFSKVGSMAGVNDPSWGTSTVWLDLDDDSDLDLYVVNYLDLHRGNSEVCEYNGKKGYCGPGSYQATADRVYLNQNDGTFIESAGKMGLEAVDGKGLAVIAADFDYDGMPDVYVANDMAANFLFTRTRDLADGPRSSSQFHNVAQASGCAVSRDGKNEASMGIACADFDGDGLIDIFLTHYFQAKNTLYRNRGSLIFDDDSRRSRIAATSFATLGFGTATFDYDRDGGIDLFITNGHVLGPEHEPFAMKPQLLRNDGTGRFDDISPLAGEYFLDRFVGRGVATGDYDNDGDADLAVTHLHRPMSLLRNETETGRHFLGLQLKTATRTLAVGGRVVLTFGKQKRVIALTSGGSYLSSSDSRLLVGLGDFSGTVDLEIRWPSGKVEQFQGLENDRYWLIVEGHQSMPFTLP